MEICPGAFFLSKEEVRKFEQTKQTRLQVEIFSCEYLVRTG